MKVSKDRTEFSRCPRRIFKADIGQRFFEKKLLLHSSLSYSSGASDRFDAAAHPNIKVSRTQLDFMGKYDFPRDVYLRFIVKNLLADDHMKPAWTVNQFIG